MMDPIRKRSLFAHRSMPGSANRLTCDLQGEGAIPSPAGVPTSGKPTSTVKKLKLVSVCGIGLHNPSNRMRPHGLPGFSSNHSCSNDKPICSTSPDIGKQLHEARKHGLGFVPKGFRLASNSCLKQLTYAQLFEQFAITSQYRTHES